MAKTWFITGISSGLGQALAEEVMAKGDYVIGTLRKSDQVDAYNEKYKGRAEAVLADITDFKRMGELISNVPCIDVLVNNAGIGFVGAIEETSLEETRGVFEANFFAALWLTQLVLPKMRDRSGGHIVQISSHAGIKAFAGFGIYSASKFALEGFTEALAQEVIPLGIKVTLVEPGPFRTQFASKGLSEAKRLIHEYDESAGAFRNTLKGVHGKQEGDPKKAAKAIVGKVVSGSSSLRMPLGKIPMATIQIKLDSVKSDLEENRTVAENVVFR